MKRKYVKGAAMAIVMAVMVQNAAFADEAGVSVSGHQTSVEQARTEEEWAKLRDNVVEWDELEDLVHEYNPTVSDLWITFRQEDSDGQYSTDYEDVLSMLQDNYESSMSSASSEVLEALVDLQYSTSYTDASIDSQAQSTDRTVSQLSVEKSEKSVTETIRQSIISMYEAELQQQINEAAVTYDETLYNSAVNKLASGMATETDVLSAQETLENAKLTVIENANDSAKSRQLLNINLGYERNTDVQYPSVPEVTDDVFAAINPETDAETAISNNYDIKTNERKLSIATANSTISTLETTIAAEKENVRANVLGLYNTLKQAKNSYEQASLSETNTVSAFAKAQRSYASGNASLRELEKAEYNATVAALNTKLSRYKYAAAYYNYAAAVQGLASSE